MTLVAFALTALAAWFGTGLHPVWWALWIAPIPVLLATARLSGRAAFAVAAGAWAIAGLNMWTYYRVAIGIPAAVALALVLLPAVVFGAAAALWRAALRRELLWAQAISLPLVWTSYEFAMARLSPHSTFGSLGYTQMDCLPSLQVASVAGIGAVSFIVLLFPSVVATLLAHRNARGKVAVAAALVFATALGWGALRLTTASNAPSVRVALLASDARENRYAEAEKSPELAARYAEAISRIEPGVQAVVIPEKLARVTDAQIANVDAAFGKGAHGGLIVAGVERWTGGKRFNEARVYGAAGMVPAVYEKHHMIPGFEGDLTPGTERTVFAEPSGVWGIAICKDMDFPRLSREYSHDGVGLLLVPAWDFDADAWLHDRMAIARGVESGFTIARSAKQGLLTVSDSRGRVLAEARSDSAPFTVLVANAPVRHEATLYARFGDWFGWTNVFLLTIVVASIAVKKLSV